MANKSTNVSVATDDLFEWGIRHNSSIIEYSALGDKAAACSINCRLSCLSWYGNLQSILSMNCISVLLVILMLNYTVCDSDKKNDNFIAQF
jgi:hypothetical protein